MSDEIVGHKTMFSKERGYWHEPLTRTEADAILKACEEKKAKRDALMPDEESAIRMLADAVHRLNDFGWRDPIYCPKNGSHFLVLEAGSTGKHQCHYVGEWPDGSWWVADECDVSPSRPVLFKPIETTR